MTRLVHMLEKIRLPFAYDHFAEGESPAPPFFVYRFVQSENFGADNFAYYRTREMRLELYTDKKDLEAERKVERVLDREKLYHDMEETWISSERLFEVAYTIYIGEEWLQ